MEFLTALFYFTGTVIFVAGLITVAYYPLSLVFELRNRRYSQTAEFLPAVSVLVPAFNEELVIKNCVSSILASDYPDMELLLIDDGSSDGTLHLMRQFDGHPAVTVIAQENGGKATALNRGLASANGEIILCVDADGLFAADTIRQMVEPFKDPAVGAVCGNDSPVNLNSLQTHLLSILARVGTGFVRRALSVANCLPIVAGNSGAFRREALQKAGTFLPGFIGEDLELTWRVHKAGYQVRFQPRATVYAEVPATILGLWKQRVRWARGLLQTVNLHRDMFFNPRYRLFGFFLPLNALRMVVVPLLQLLAVMLLLALLLLGHSPLPADLLVLAGWLGLGVAVFTSVFAIALDGAWRDLKYLYVLPLWIPYSLLMSVIMLRALLLELRGKEALWHKLDRTGVISRSAAGQ